MGIFDTNIIEQPLTLSSYSILPGVDNSVYFDIFYEELFTKEVCWKGDVFLGIHGIIDKIGKMPIDYLYEFKQGNTRPILNFLKPYTRKGTRIKIIKTQNKFKFKFQNTTKSGYFDIICAVNVYTR